MGFDPSPADTPCCPLTLSELGVCLQASLGKSDTPCSLLRDSGPGPQKGATQVILMPPEQLVARKENGPVGLRWERYIPASSQPSEGIRNLGRDGKCVENPKDVKRVCGTISGE